MLTRPASLDTDARPPALSRLGLGCSRLGSFGNRASDADQAATVLAALDAGVTVFDTANVYGQGDSERTLGRLLGSRRDEVFLVTKLGKHFSAKMRLMRPFKPLLKPLLAKRGGAVTAQRGDNISADFTPALFGPTLDASLKRLGFDHVDALLLHSPSAEAIRVPGVGEALDGLVRSGRARQVGISVDDRAALETALALPAVSIVQVPYDLIAAADDGLLAQARARGVIVLAREVIRLQPALAPTEALRTAYWHPDIDCVLFGASSPARVAEAVAAC